MKRIKAYIYGAIGYDVTGASVMAQLSDKNYDEVEMRIASPGGSVTDGQAIMSYLQSLDKPIDFYVDGIVASMATMITTVGRKVYMDRDALFMIHNPSSFSAGDAKDIQKDADVLGKIETVMVQAYARKSGKDESVVRAWMDDETWFTADEALKNGFIDEIIEAKAKVAASTDFARVLANYRNVPNVAKPKPKPNNTMKEIIAGKLGLAEDAKETSILSKVDGLLSDVQAKSDLITSLNAQVDTLKGENATLEVAVNDSQEKLQGFEVLDVVAKVQSESKHTVGKEHIENLKRRASRWLGCTDESEKEDIYADMATYCKANGVELGKGDLGKGSRPDEPVELTEQEKINKRADEIIASDKTISFGKAVIMAVKEMETK